MAHRHAVSGRTALTVLGALVLAGLPAAAAAEPAAPAPSAARTLGANAASPAVLRALERDLGLTAARVRTRLVNEAEAGTRAGRLQNALGKRFAGAWVSGATSADLTVATTEIADSPAIEAGGARAVVVTNPLEELRTARAKLDAAVTGKALDTPVRYIDVRTNRVTVQATSRAAADTLVATAGVDSALVDVEVSADRPRALYDIKGGDPFYIGDRARCSVGFGVTKGAQQGFATAGHCGRAGATTAGFNQVAQGTFQASVFPGRDMAWVRTDADWTATPAVKGEGGRDVLTAGSVQALTGAAVCRSGSTTGWHCGTIQQHGTSVSYAEGTVQGVTRTTVCAEPGDSGGSFLSGVQAQGVTSGGSGDCTRGGTTFYQPINPLLSTYGLTLSTSTDSGAGTDASGTPAPEDGQEGGWAAGRVYEVGARVTYDGVSYECLQSHQAQTAWQPALAPGLWQRV